MGKFRTCAVTFKQGQEVFREGERVSGTVMLDVTEAVVVRRVRVFCYGLALTKWTKEFTRDWDKDLISREEYFNRVCTLFGRKQNEEGPNPTLPAGNHRWGFAFRLPEDRLPSSFEGHYGAVRWFLKVEVDKPFPSINNKWYKPFTVLSNLNLNEAEYQRPMKVKESKTVSKALGIGNAGTLTLFVQTDHSGYCPGEAIVLKVEAKNDSTKDLGKISAILEQEVDFRAADETRDSNLGVASLQTELSLAKGTTMTLTDIQLSVPAVPPSTRKRTCHIISCTYTLRVSVHVPWGLDLEACLPVTIGTVPRGYRLPSTQAAGTGAKGAGASSVRPIQYVRCRVGITPCTKSDGIFPNLPYTPHTAVHCPPPTGPQPSPTRPQPSPTRPQPSPTPPRLAPSAPSLALLSSQPASAGATSASSAVVRKEMDQPPAYEQVMRMEEERERNSPKTPAATAAPEGRKCVVLLVRFPDSSLSSFRQTIRREQNNLLDNGEAFLAALCPQPLLGLESPEDLWPEHAALALFVFPDAESGEGWMRGVSEKGDSWYPDSDILMVPANWTIPSDNNKPLVFNIAATKVREGVTKEQLTAFAKDVIPFFTKLSKDNGAVRQSAGKKATVLHGKWASNEHFLTLTRWPKVHNYMAFVLQCGKENNPQNRGKARELYDTQTVLLISEDVTSLSTQPVASPDDDATAADDDVNSGDEESAEEENKRVENVLSEKKQESTPTSD